MRPSLPILMFTRYKIYQLILPFFTVQVIHQKYYWQNLDFGNAHKYTDTWGQLILLTTILSHKSCMNTSRQVLEKTLFAINAIFTQDNNLSKTKVEGSLQKTNATCSKCINKPNPSIPKAFVFTITKTRVHDLVR